MKMTRPQRHWRMAVFWAVVLSVIPYLLVKVAWLSGSAFGMRPDTGLGQMGTPRFVIGNLISIGMELTAVVLALALIQRWGRRIPSWSHFVVGGAATGLLAPILLGVPLGSAFQLAIEGEVTSGGEGNLEGWLFAIVYGGFGVLAVALTILLALHAEDRWGNLIAAGPRPPANMSLTLLCGIGMLTFAGAMAYWGVAGPGTTGPAGMTSLAQRTVLVVTSIAAAAGFLAPLLPRGSVLRSRAAAVTTWVGCATAALQGPTGLALAHDGRVSAVGVAIAAMGTATGTIYGLAVLKSTRRDVDSSSPQAWRAQSPKSSSSGSG
jgi:hypothetical protein